MENASTGKHESLVTRQYGKQAAFYSVSSTHATGDTLGMLVELANPSGDERVLDVATGTGFCAMAFAPRVASVVAYDLTREMLAEAERLSRERGLTNLSFRQGPAERLPFEQAEFDVVSSRVAPHHFASLPDFLSESLRVLKPGGRLLIADTSAPANEQADRWQNEVELLRDPSHVRDWNEAEWRDFVARAGFEVLEASERSRTGLTFADWVRRSGTSEAVVTQLRELFAGAPPAAVQAFDIRPLPPDDFAWSWPVIVLSARKPSRG